MSRLRGHQLIDMAGTTLQSLDRQLDPAVMRDVSPLFVWVAFNLGAAHLAEMLVEKLKFHSDFEEVKHLLLEDSFDIYEVATLSLSARSVATPLDLCAAVLFRINGGVPDTDKEVDVDEWFRRIKSLDADERHIEWMQRLKGHHTWRWLKDARDKSSHRALRKSVRLSIGSPRTPTDEVYVGGEFRPLHQLVHTFSAFGQDRFCECCEMLGDPND